MSYIWDIIKGAVIGVANIIPGVSGGTMAVSLGIYDRLIYALTDLFKNWRKSVRTLLPIVIGAALGIIGFTYAVEFLLRCYALPTCLAFIGLIAGGVPMLWRSYKGSLELGSGRVTIGNAVIFIAMFCLSAFLPMLHHSQGTMTNFGSDIGTLVLLFLIGMIASATMVIPGISGSMVLMILGYYYGVINTLKSFFDAVKSLNFTAIVRAGIPLFFFGIGVLLGIFLVAKCIRWLFQKQAAATCSGILGLIAAAPVAMLYNTGALTDLALPNAVLRVAAGILLMIVCFFTIYLTGGHKRRKSE